jgi:hypothetical protein
MSSASRQNTIFFVISGETRGHLFQVEYEDWTQKSNRFYIIDPETGNEYAEFQVRKVDVPYYYNIIQGTVKTMSNHVGVCQVQSTLNKNIKNYLIVEEVDNVVFLNCDEFQNLMIYKSSVRVEK